MLKDAIHEINHHNASGLSFEELYRNAYNMILHRHGQKLYDGLVDVLTTHLKRVATEVTNTPGEEYFLAELDRRWKNHVKSMQMIRDILMYMDRIFVIPNGLRPVHNLGLDLWRDHLMRCPTIRDRVQTVVLALIDRERSGERVGHATLRATSQMMMELGVAVYAADLEKPLLEATASYYRCEAHVKLIDSTCPEYLRGAERRLVEEARRVSDYLNPRSESRIVACVEEELLGRPMSAVLGAPNTGLIAMLSRDEHGESHQRLVQMVFTLRSEWCMCMRSVWARHAFIHFIIIVSDMHYRQPIARALYDATRTGRFRHDARAHGGSRARCWTGISL